MVRLQIEYSYSCLYHDYMYCILACLLLGSVLEIKTTMIITAAVTITFDFLFIPGYSGSLSVASQQVQSSEWFAVVKTGKKVK